MDIDREYEPDYASLKALLLQMAQERAVVPLLNLIVRKLARRPYMALARIWLIQQGNCPCHAREPACDGQGRCLHLVASDGRSLVDKQADWTRVEGEFSRFPLGARKIGWIAATGRAVEVSDVEKNSEWIAKPDWAHEERILGFGGQPLRYKGEVLGVMAVFSRMRLKHEELVWMRMVADHAATAIVNARAFETIGRQRKQKAGECLYLRKEVQAAGVFGAMVGQSEALKSVIHQVELVAPAHADVLISGEPGTGKELVAREIHSRSTRRHGPFVKINCSGIRHDHYERTLFGYSEDAFSGAVHSSVGSLAVADGGTFFLDAVDEIPNDLQRKLLGVLQAGGYQRMGEDVTRGIDIRVIAATDCDLKEEIAKGRFNRDLYYRLKVFSVEMAPLRFRKEDIPLLAEYFLGLHRKHGSRLLPHLSQSDIRRFKKYAWPGNVSELRLVIERAVIAAKGGKMSFFVPSADQVVCSNEDNASVVDLDGVEIIPDAEVKRLERQNTLAALKKCGWRIYGDGGAADLLGVKPTTLSSRIKKMNIKKPVNPIVA